MITNEEKNAENNLSWNVLLSIIGAVIETEG